MGRSTRPLLAPDCPGDAVLRPEDRTHCRAPWLRRPLHPELGVAVAPQSWHPSRGPVWDVMDLFHTEPPTESIRTPRCQNTRHREFLERGEIASTSTSRGGEPVLDPLRVGVEERHCHLWKLPVCGARTTSAGKLRSTGPRVINLTRSFQILLQCVDHTLDLRLAVELSCQWRTLHRNPHRLPSPTQSATQPMGRICSGEARLALWRNCPTGMESPLETHPWHI